MIKMIGWNAVFVDLNFASFRDPDKTSWLVDFKKEKPVRKFLLVKVYNKIVLLNRLSIILGNPKHAQFQLTFVFIIHYFFNKVIQKSRWRFKTVLTKFFNFNLIKLFWRHIFQSLLFLNIKSLHLCIFVLKLIFILCLT